MKPNLTSIYRNLRYRMILAGDYGARNLFQNGEEGVWYDPSDLTTMFQDAAGTTAAVVGQPVGKILDKSGNGNHATQSTDLSRPVLRQSGDKYYLEFDGVDDFMATPSIDFSATDKMSVFAGMRKLSDATSYAVVVEASPNWNTNNGSFALFAPADTATSKTYGSTSKGNAVANAAHFSNSTGDTAPITSVLTTTHDISGDVTTLRVNTSAKTSGTLDKGTGNFGNYPLYLGRRGGSTLPFNGHLYSLIVRGALSTSEEVANAERYVNSKTGAYND